jgi:hypothetical protein
MTELAQRATIQIGAIAIEGFMLPDSSYRMSQTQAAECVGKPQRNAGRFLESKGIKALRGNGYTPDTVEVKFSKQSRGQTRFNALPVDVEERSMSNLISYLLEREMETWCPPIKRDKKEERYD